MSRLVYFVEWSLPFQQGKVAASSSTPSTPVGPLVGRLPWRRALGVLPRPLHGGGAFDDGTPAQLWGPSHTIAGLLSYGGAGLFVRLDLGTARVVTHRLELAGFSLGGRKPTIVPGC